LGAINCNPIETFADTLLKKELKSIFDAIPNAKIMILGSPGTSKSLSSKKLAYEQGLFELMHLVNAFS